MIQLNNTSDSHPLFSHAMHISPRIKNRIEQRELTEFLVECSPLMCFMHKCESMLHLHHELELRSCSKPCHLNWLFEWVG